MNEEIRKNAEINDDELEQIAGGCLLEEIAQDCPHCGIKMSFFGFSSGYFYRCSSCNHKIMIDP